MRDALCETVAAAIRQHDEITLENARATAVGGGCINRAYALGDGAHTYFVKVNTAPALETFEAERDGLLAIRATEEIRAPRPVCLGVHEDDAYLVLEFIALRSGGGGDGAATGRQLAAMHRHASADGTFGWHRDNTIGATPQVNMPPADDWATFFRERRMRHQFELAAQRGNAICGAAELLAAIDELLADHDPAPSLLHGDLWGGNAGFDPDGNPVVYDPAVYYGDRETDIAFTEMFGGFGGEFYRAYREAFPLAPGYETRRDLYNLYHLVNHHNLFGGGYGRQAEEVISRLVHSAHA